MGRQPKPVSLHVESGTYRRDRHGVVDDPTKHLGPPVKPRGLGRVASRLWDQCVPALVEIGAVSTLDTSNLITLCRWYAVFDATMTKLEALEPDADGAYRLSTQAGHAFAAFQKLASKYGLNPTDRQRIVTTPKPTKTGARDRRA